MSLKSKIDYTKTKFTDEEKLLIRNEIEIVKHKYPDHIPIIVISKDKNLKLSKNKYLVGSSLSISHLQNIIRKKLLHSLTQSEALYLLIKNNSNGILLQGNMLISTIYNTYADSETKMLFIEIYKENTFG
jgi:hypothetical protein